MVQLAQEVIAAAQAAQKATKVPASVSLAQYGLESAWGRLTTGKNNFFGIKSVSQDGATLCWTHEDYHGQWVKIQDWFKNYDSVGTAFLAHAYLLSQNPRYSKAMSLCDKPEEFAQALTGIYATDPEYGNKLVEIMRTSDLERYDV